MPMPDRPDNLFTSARYDPALLASPSNTLTNPPSAPSPYLVLPYHRDRLVSAALAFNWTEAAASLTGEGGFTRFRDELDLAVAGQEAKAGMVAPLKVRFPPEPRSVHSPC